MSIRILVVDDTRFLRMMLSDILNRSGFEVVGEAENGEVSIQKFRELRPDIVMMDITMPEMDGITALKEIKVIDPDAIIIICSAMSQRDLISKALKAGANGYVMKPFRPDAVKEIIDEVLPLIEARKNPVVEPTESGDETFHLNLDSESNKVETIEEDVVITDEEKSILMTTSDEFGEDDVSVESVESNDFIESSELYAEDRYDDLNDVETTDESAVLENPVTVPSDDSNYLIIEGTAKELGNHFVFSAFQSRKKSSSNSAIDSEPEFIFTTAPEYDFKEPNEPNESLGDFMEQDDSVVGDELESLTESNETDDIESVNSDEVEQAAITDSDTMDTNTTNDVPELTNEVIDPLQDEPVRNEKSIGGLEDMENNKDQVAATMEMSNAGFDTIPANKKRKSIKNLMSSFMCNWVEEMNEQDVDFQVVYSESDQSIRVNMAKNNDEKQSIQFSLEGFSYLVEWLEEKGVDLGRVNNE